MSEHFNPRDESQQLLKRLLHDLPHRRAPATLERRVLAELERRAALPWWRRGFAHWPVISRVAFVAICGAMSELSILGISWDLFRARADAALALAASWTHPAAAAFASVVDVASVLVDVIPRHWAYALISAAAVLYLVLFGLGATAYRSIYRHIPRPGHLS